MRPALLAGTWYPDTPEACRQFIEAHARGAARVQGAWRGILAPHAGWRYSGRLAVAAVGALQSACPDADLVVVFGSHRGPEGPDTVLRAPGWETPLGAVHNVVDLAAELAATLDLEEEPVHPRIADNGIEVLLPFVRWFFAAARVLLVGVRAAPEALGIGDAVGRLCRGRGYNAVFVGSTDLTHYGPAYRMTEHGPARRAVPWVREVNDAAFLGHAASGDAAAPEALLQHARLHRSACCPGAAAAARRAAAVFEPRPKPVVLEHVLSWDMAPSENFVGYAGVVF